eukprot:55552_1
MNHIWTISLNSCTNQPMKPMAEHEFMMRCTLVKHPSEAVANEQMGEAIFRTEIPIQMRVIISMNMSKWHTSYHGKHTWFGLLPKPKHNSNEEHDIIRSQSSHVHK